MPAGRRTIAIDANVLINFIHVDHLDYLGRLPGLDAVVPLEAVAEVTEPSQAAALNAALKNGSLHSATVTGTRELSAYADFVRRLGKGESACLALASNRGWCVASDEKRAFRRTAIEALGEASLFTTPDLIIQLIGGSVITMDEADRWKATLAGQRFRMKFDSFSEFF